MKNCTVKIRFHLRPAPIFHDIPAVLNLLQSFCLLTCSPINQDLLTCSSISQDLNIALGKRHVMGQTNAPVSQIPDNSVYSFHLP